MADATTTPTDTRAPWIDPSALVPTETQDRVAALLDRCEAIAPAVRELSIEAHQVLEEIDRIYRDVEFPGDDDGEIRSAMSDGLLDLVGQLSGGWKLREALYELTTHLFAALGDPSAEKVDWQEPDQKRATV